MRIKLNIKRQVVISSTQADELLEKYYEGKTSVREENMLRAFLAQPDIPERFDAERDIFGYFQGKKAKQTVSLPQTFKWAAAVAVIAVVISGGLFFYRTPATISYAYIDGEKTTDVNMIKSLAFTSFSNIASENNEIENNLNDIQNDGLIKTQLELFSEIDF